MAAITTTADGTRIVLALDGLAANPAFVSCARTDLTTWTVDYDPGAGSAANVAMVPGNADELLFYGNFGTDVTVIKRTISTDTNTDISPASLGAKIVNTAAVNPSDGNEIVITVDTDQDITHTTDNGTTWSAWSAALGFDATALWVLWSGRYYLHRYFVAGDNTTTLDILYSPNEGYGSTDVSGATIGALTDIVSVEANDL